MTSIRPAQVYDSNALSELAIRSEAYWGYDLDYMEKFRSIYNVTEDFIRESPTYVMEEDGVIIGFYGILIENDKTSLEYLYVEAKYIGKGYGKVLWKHMVETCKKLDIKEFEIVTSPQAKDFYTKMGAKSCGEVESLVMNGRRIPKLIYTVS